jgi:hypothetical protein
VSDYRWDGLWYKEEKALGSGSLSYVVIIALSLEIAENGPSSRGSELPLGSLPDQQLLLFEQGFIERELLNISRVC